MSTSNINHFIGVDEMKNYKTIWRPLVAEYLGTSLYLAILLLLGTETDTSPDAVRVGLANGLLIASIIQIIAHVSGGHINPAITAGAILAGRLKLLKGLCYMVIQILGAITGAAITYLLTTSESRLNIDVASPGQIPIGTVFGVEVLITFTLVAVVLSVTDPVRVISGAGQGALAVGLSVTACHCACLDYSGVMNPARALGSAVVMNVWTDHWVYWLGPLSGGLLAGIVYRCILVIRRPYIVEE